MVSKNSAEIIRINRLAVKALLGGRDLSASDLARAIGVSPQYMSDMLYGRRNPAKHIAAIAKVLEVRPSRIVIKSEPLEETQRAA